MTCLGFDWLLKRGHERRTTGDYVKEKRKMRSTSLHFFSAPRITAIFNRKQGLSAESEKLDSMMAKDTHAVPALDKICRSINPSDAEYQLRNKPLPGLPTVTPTTSTEDFCHFSQKLTSDTDKVHISPASL